MRYCLNSKIKEKGGIYIIKDIKKEIQYLRKKLETAKKELETLPQGSLRCTSSNGTDQFYIDGHYISKKNVELVTKVAQREYYERLVPVLEDTIQRLCSVIELYDNHVMEKCFDKQCKARKQLVTPSIQSIDMKVEAFMKQTYEPSGFSDEDMTEFYTHKGERVRSKSEKKRLQHCVKRSSDWMKSCRRCA